MSAAPAYNNGMYTTVQSTNQSNKRWRILPNLQPPKSMEELERIRKMAVQSRKGGGVPLQQLEPDPFYLCEKNAKKYWQYTRGDMSFTDRPRTTASRKKHNRSDSPPTASPTQNPAVHCDSNTLDGNTEFGTLFTHHSKRNHHTLPSSVFGLSSKRPTTSPEKNLYASSSVVVLRPTTFGGNQFDRSHASTKSHHRSVPTLLSLMPSQDPFSAARKSTVESNNGLTHLTLHLEANSMPPGGIRQRPTSSGVISTIGGHNFPGIRPKVCKREYYHVPDTGAFDITKRRNHSNNTVNVDDDDEEDCMDEDDDDESIPLLLSKRLKRFALGQSIEIREINHKFTGLYRPATVHHKHNTGFLDVVYQVNDLSHYRFHIDPRAARVPPNYLHRFSLSAPPSPVQPPFNSTQNSKAQQESTTSLGLVLDEELEHHTRHTIKQPFQPFETSTIVPPIRQCSAEHDNILTSILPTPKYVENWANAAVCQNFRLAGVIPMEKKMIANRCRERTYKLHVLLPNGSYESKRVPICLLQRCCEAFVPLLVNYLSWKSVYPLLYLTCSGFYASTKYVLLFASVFNRVYKVNVPGNEQD